MSGIKLKQLPQFKRPREKLFEKGPQGLTNYELLAILLRTGYRGMNVLDVAKRILKTKKLDEFSTVSLKELAHLKGIGISRAASIIAGIEFSRRVFQHDDTPSITSPEDIMHVVPALKHKKREHFIGIYLNARHHVITTHIISIGTLDASIVHPREVFQPAIYHSAASVVITHNHPSGDPDPSNADIILTKRLVEAGRILGIKILDHVIVSKNQYSSFRELELI